MTSEALRAAVHAADGIEIHEKTPVESLQPTGVVLANGKVLSAPCVIDGRGFAPHDALKLGFQKFLGQEIETDQAHGEKVPTIMDARVAQLDGYRFVYVLPLSPTRLLIEDTRYSDGEDLDDDAFRVAIRAYAAERQWAIRSVVREERGALPITLAADVRPLLARTDVRRGAGRAAGRAFPADHRLQPSRSGAGGQHHRKGRAVR